MGLRFVSPAYVQVPDAPALRLSTWTAEACFRLLRLPSPGETVFVLSKGKCLSMHSYPTRAEALEAVGLRE